MNLIKSYTYKVIQSKDIRELETKVSYYLNNNWGLQGGIHADEFGYYQAISKSELVNEDENVV